MSTGKPHFIDNSSTGLVILDRAGVKTGLAVHSPASEEQNLFFQLVNF